MCATCFEGVSSAEEQHNQTQEQRRVQCVAGGIWLGMELTEGGLSEAGLEERVFQVSLYAHAAYSRT